MPTPEQDDYLRTALGLDIAAYAPPDPAPTPASTPDPAPAPNPAPTTDVVAGPL